jgi:hypothetical protein
MKDIKIKFTDFPGPCNPEAIISMLSKKYSVIIEDKDPDYVIYSVFGYDFLNYKNSIRIFFTGENVHPDFNLCDYAFGFDWLEFEDRYCRCPNYLLYKEFSELLEARSSKISPKILDAKKFCNFIYSNANAAPYREEIFHKLNKYKKVDSAGLYLNNTNLIVGSPSLGNEATQNKIVFQKNYKFSIAIENSSTIGYTTEKIIHALIANTIPIYWGNPKVGREFNTKRIINCHEYDSIDQVVERVIEIDNSNELYSDIINEPIFPDNIIPYSLNINNIINQFDHIFSQGDLAYRRNNYVWGKIYEDKRLFEINASKEKNIFKKYH